MNIFRLLADLLHAASFLVLLVKIRKSKSSAGISGRSQVLLTSIRYTLLRLIYTVYIVVQFDHETINFDVYFRDNLFNV
jgi:ER lumen protein retaining receptor